jgi:uridine kinase
MPVIVGIAGGSASGKTTLAKRIIEILGEDHISFIGHDSYYKNLDHLSMEDRAKNNFDHPDSLDTALLIKHLQLLKAGKTIQVPTYDFNTHTRTMVSTTIEPRKVILVDGILIFAESELVQLMDLKIFVDTDDDIRLIRRIQRDTIERGRTTESIIEQYLRTVRPMHDLYVEPSKRKADIILPAGDGIPPAALEMCISRLREIINFYQ